MIPIYHWPRVQGSLHSSTCRLLGVSPAKHGACGEGEPELDSGMIQDTNGKGLAAKHR
jgi:hypothetical protein